MRKKKSDVFEYVHEHEMCMPERFHDLLCLNRNVEIYELCGLGMATVHIQKISFLRKCSWARSVDQIYSKHLAYVFCQRSVGKNIFGKVGLGFV